MFNTGDIVRCINSNGNYYISNGHLYTVERCLTEFVYFKETGDDKAYVLSRFVLVAKAEHVELTKNEIEYKKIERHYVNLHDVRTLLRGDQLAMVSESLWYAINLVQKELDTLKAK